MKIVTLWHLKLSVGEDDSIEKYFNSHEDLCKFAKSYFSGPGYTEEVLDYIIANLIGCANPVKALFDGTDYYILNGVEVG